MEHEILNMEGNNDARAGALKNELAEAVRFLSAKGWMPASSGNSSFRISGDNKYWISVPAADKAVFSQNDFMEIDPLREANDEKDARSPAETLLHTLLYENPDVNVILHTHSLNGTVISAAHKNDGEVKLSGFELLKELNGVNTHDTTVSVPVFPNMQDIKRLSHEVRRYMRGRSDFRAFLMSGHGLYSWGKTVAEAKKYIEIFEFLFECTFNLKIYSLTKNS